MSFFRSAAVLGGLFTGTLMLGALWFYRMEVSYNEIETKEGYKTKSFHMSTAGAGQIKIKTDEETAKNELHKEKVRHI